MSDQPLYLHRRSERGYTSDEKQAMRGAPDPGEAVDPGEVSGLGVSLAARERFEELHATELAQRAAVSRSKRLRDLQNEVIRLDVDAHRELRAVDAQLDLVAGKLARRRNMDRAA